MDGAEERGYPRVMSDKPDKVADALPNSWVYKLLPQSVWPYAQLARWERPIGWWLLLWPCWWSIMLAAFSSRYRLEIEDPSLPMVGVFQFDQKFEIAAALLLMPLFLVGAMSMRGAGCTYNDIVDVDLDEQVARTASRPIPSGRVSKRNAALFLIAQALIGCAILFLLCSFMTPFNWFAFFLGVASLAIVALYPFAKRITDWPQLVLGLAFSWGALIGWAVVFGTLSAPPLLLYAGSILWTIGYDTIYAHQDREDDALVGVRSTARLFGENTKPALIALYSGTLVLIGLAYWLVDLSWLAYFGLAIGCSHMIWQIATLNINDADNCLKLFQSNKHFGWIIFAGLWLELFFG